MKDIWWCLNIALKMHSKKFVYMKMFQHALRILPRTATTPVGQILSQKCTFGPAVVHHGTGRPHRHKAVLRATAPAVHSIQGEPGEGRKTQEKKVRSGNHFDKPRCSFSLFSTYFLINYGDLGMWTKKNGTGFTHIWLWLPWDIYITFKRSGGEGEVGGRWKQVECLATLCS